MALEKTYNPRNFLGSFGEANLVGFGPDTFMEIAYTNDRTTTQVGVDGRVSTRSTTNNYSATMTFTCMAHAPVNDALSRIAEADRLAGTGVRHFGCRDTTTGSTFAAADAWIQKVPDASFAAEAGIYVWVFATDHLVSVFGDPLTRIA